MDANIRKMILKATNAKEIVRTQLIQNLWDNYGELLRVHLRDGDATSVILKHIKLPSKHARAKDSKSDLSSRRKLKSYKVEICWYETYNKINLRDHGSPTALKLASFQGKDELFLLLEDLDTRGFGKRIAVAGIQEMKLVLSWLACFHAKFMQHGHQGLWNSGTYWHLETRPDELQILDDLRLKQAAPLIDHKLKNTRYLTIVHGDAKLANFCFSSDRSQVAAVDFQYAGRGCGMKDVAYFIGSCLREDQCEAMEGMILDFYFSALLNNLKDSQIDKHELEHQWRASYHVAWADFHRFIKGWSPGFWKKTSYSEKITKKVIDDLYLELLQVAIHACVAAGRIVRSYWRKDIAISSKDGATASSRVVTEADLISQRTILSILEPSMKTYDLGLLAEEERDNRSRLEKAFFWSVDPLDGTLPFSEGESGFAVTIALISKMGDPILGVVYDPVTETLFHAIQNQGCYQNNRPIQLDQNNVSKRPIHLFADRSLKQEKNYPDLKEKFTVHFTGGAVMNTIHVLLHQNACYLKYPKEEVGGCAIWDLAAVSLILKEAGGIMTNMNGGALSFNQVESVYFNKEGIIACSNKKIFDEVNQTL
ncbi:MAG: phosphotransferase [Magnetococcales bacterium]|nr:phosphotransferase [Magnetococcales bacterium]